MSACFQCGKELTYNEIGAYKKVREQGARRSFCVKRCLAGRLDVPVELIDQKIEHFKQQGCTLFI
mgnify:CR=1 FL=1